MYQAVDTNQNPCSTDAILERVNPVRIIFTLLDAHHNIVACGLRLSSDE